MRFGTYFLDYSFTLDTIFLHRNHIKCKWAAAFNENKIVGFFLMCSIFIAATSAAVRNFMHRTKSRRTYKQIVTVI